MFSRLNSPSSQPLLLSQMVQSVIFVVLCWTLSSKFTSLLYQATKKQTQHSWCITPVLASPASLLRVRSVPSSRSLMQMLNSTESSNNSWGTTTGWPLSDEFYAVGHNPLRAWQFSQFSGTSLSISLAHTSLICLRHVMGHGILLLVGRSLNFPMPGSSNF